MIILEIYVQVQHNIIILKMESRKLYQVVMKHIHILYKLLPYHINVYKIVN